MGFRLLESCAVVLWLSAVVNAAARQCSHPEIKNGYFVSEGNTFEHDTQLYYSCMDGYKPVQDDWWATVTCQDGTWSSEPKCIEESACFDPEFPNANYTRFNYVNNGDKVWIRCNPGYEDNKKRAKALCENGEWRVLPLCEKMDSWCGPPPPIPHGAIINQDYNDMYPEDTEMEYSCQDGFEPGTQSTKFYCSNGQWNLSPSCIKSASSAVPLPDSQPMLTTIANCGTPKTIANGEFFKSSMSVSYQCNVYYKLRGEETLTCYGNRKWSHEAPTCEVNYCELDTSLFQHLENKGSVFIQSGTTMKKLKCFNSSWRTARAECINNQLRLTECCYSATHYMNNCDYTYDATS